MAANVRATSPAASPGSRNGVGNQIKAAAIRLIPSAVLLWAVLAGIGHLLTHQLRHSGVVRWDASVDRALANHRSGGWSTVTHFATFGAETSTVIVLGVVVFVALRLMLKRWRESAFVAVALIGEVSIFVCTTLVVDRARPAVPHLDSAPATSSFPSGHTAAAVTLYGALAIVAFVASRHGWPRTVLAALAVLMPVAVAMSRLYRGMHFPTDVLAGALLGVLWLSIVRIVILPSRRTSRELL
jgi:membrane-associated phospholipid phosphatase